MASSRWVCHGPAKCLQTNAFRKARPRSGVPRIVRRYRGFRQGTDNERSLALGGSAGSHVAVESASASTVREPDSCCSSRRKPPPNYSGCPSGARLNFCLSTNPAATRAPIAYRCKPLSSRASVWPIANTVASTREATLDAYHRKHPVRGVACTGASRGRHVDAAGGYEVASLAPRVPCRSPSSP
jgi:hypothetical protein